MYRRPKFLEILLEIRQEMALEADYDVDLFAEIARSGNRPAKTKQTLTGRTRSDGSPKDVEIPNLMRSRRR